MKLLKVFVLMAKDFASSSLAIELKGALKLMLLGLVAGIIVIGALVFATDGIIEEEIRLVDMFWPMESLLMLVLLGWLSMAGVVAVGFGIYAVFFVLLYLIAGMIGLPGTISRYLADIKKRVNDETDI